MSQVPKVEGRAPKAKNVRNDGSMNLASGSAVVVVEGTFFKVWQLFVERQLLAHRPEGP